MQVKILLISTIWTLIVGQKNDITINMRKKLWYFFLSMNTLTMSLQETQPRTHINVFSECFPRAGVWIIDDLRCPQSVVPLTRCHKKSIQPYTERRRCATATKHEPLLELNRLILFTENFCLKVDLISGETEFLQEQFHSVYATDTLTCSSVKRMFSCITSLKRITFFCSWVSWM